MKGIKDVEESIGGMSKYQMWVIFLVGLTCLPESFLTQSAIYMSGVPTHRYVYKTVLFINNCFVIESIYILKCL